jgi:hypothetical protein
MQNSVNIALDAPDLKRRLGYGLTAKITGATGSAGRVDVHPKATGFLEGDKLFGGGPVSFLVDGIK